jgi:hypothetical protein
MNRVLASTLTLALLALPLAAEEAKKTDTRKAKPKETTAASAPAQPAQEDSPLVAAAKRANRLGKKPASKILITNETLKTSGTNAHVTTAEEYHTITLPPESGPTPEMIAAKQAAEKRQAEQEAVDAKKKEEEMRQARLRRAAQGYEEAYPDDLDPAESEREMNAAHGEPAKSEKPPR